jgi:hypothetical protein
MLPATSSPPMVAILSSGRPRRRASAATRRAAAGGLAATEIAEDRNPVPRAVGEDRLQQALEHRLEPGIGIAPALELGERDGAFAQRLEEQGGGKPAADQGAHHGYRCVDPVAREARRIAHEEHPISLPT